MYTASRAAEADTNGISEIERERIRRIALNKERLNQCKVLEAAGDLAFKTAPRPRAQRVVRKAKKEREGGYERRHSMRTLNQPPPKYRDVYDVDARTVMRTTKTATRRSSEALDAAREAARAKMDELGDDAVVKDMLISHVSGGFWLQVPQPLVATVGFTDKRAILLRNVYDTSSRPPDTTYCENVARLEWACVWLPRAGAGAGLSGGWRGFSIDHDLTPNDSLVFEVVPDPEHDKVLQVYIYRGNNFERGAGPDDTQPKAGPARKGRAARQKPRWSESLTEPSTSATLNSTDSDVSSPHESPSRTTRNSTGSDDSSAVDICCSDTGDASNAEESSASDASNSGDSEEDSDASDSDESESDSGPSGSVINLVSNSRSGVSQKHLGTEPEPKRQRQRPAKTVRERRPPATLPKTAVQPPPSPAAQKQKRMPRAKPLRETAAPSRSPGTRVTPQKRKANPESPVAPSPQGPAPASDLLPVPLASPLVTAKTPVKATPRKSVTGKSPPTRFNLLPQETRPAGDAGVSLSPGSPAGPSQVQTKRTRAVTASGAPPGTAVSNPSAPSLPVCRPSSAAAAPMTPSPKAAGMTRGRTRAVTKTPELARSACTAARKAGPGKACKELPSSREASLINPVSGESSEEESDVSEEESGSDVSDSDGSKELSNVETENIPSELELLQYIEKFDSDSEKDIEAGTSAGEKSGTAQAQRRRMRPRGSLWRFRSGNGLPGGYAFAVGPNMPDSACCSSLPEMPEAGGARPVKDDAWADIDKYLGPWNEWEGRDAIPPATMEKLMIRSGCDRAEAHAFAKAHAKRAAAAAEQLRAAFASAQAKKQLKKQARASKAAAAAGKKAPKAAKAGAGASKPNAKGATSKLSRASAADGKVGSKTEGKAAKAASSGARAKPGGKK